MSASALYLDQESIARRLITLTDRTGYDIVQKHGQRIYGGPPPGWAGPQPGKGTEVYCYRIPRDCFEDELVPVFSAVGKIFELRLMIEFSGTNRSYCYVRYTTQEEARDAINKLNNHYIRPGYPLAVTRSVDNRKLSIKTIPTIDNKTEEEVIHELSNVVEGVDKVKFQSRGWVEVEFFTHRFAALARRQLVPGNVIMFDMVAVKQVDWTDPEVDRVGQDSQGKVIALRNLHPSTSEHVVMNLFNRLSGGQVTDVIRARNMVLVSFVSQEGAMVAMERSSDIEIGGFRLEVSWWSQKRLDRGSYSSQPRYQTSNHSAGHSQVTMAGQIPSYVQEVRESYLVDSEMSVLAQRNMMATQLASQLSHFPPGYSFAQAFSGPGLLDQSQAPNLPGFHNQPPWQPSQYQQHQFLSNQNPPSITKNTAQPINYLPTNKATPTPVISLPASQYASMDTFSLFPSSTTRPDSPRPVLAVPPVFRY